MLEMGKAPANTARKMRNFNKKSKFDLIKACF